MPNTSSTASSEPKDKPEPTPVQQHASAVEGAQSVAQAVQRVADAAVAEVRKTAPQVDLGDFRFEGTPGGKFTIRGDNNLGSSGTAKLGGRQLHTVEWGTSYIQGVLPADAQKGEVTVAVAPDLTRRGIWR